jgi:hypothetical protein
MNTEIIGLIREHPFLTFFIIVSFFSTIRSIIVSFFERNKPMVHDCNHDCESDEEE